MPDPGWDVWDLNRVLSALWPGLRNGPMSTCALWPEVRITPPDERQGSPGSPALASEVEVRGDAHITYWAWAESTPFVKIGQTQYVPVKVIGGTGQASRRVMLRGVLQQAENRIAQWTTGTPWRVSLLRVHVDAKGHERFEHNRCAQALMRDRLEWFDLRRLEANAESDA